MNQITISEDAFAALFHPEPNHLNQNASFDWGHGYGTLFETYDDELEYVKQQDSLCIWTLLSGDDGDFIASGFHFVNRLGYFIAKHPVPEGVDVEVQLDEEIP